MSATPAVQAPPLAARPPDGRRVTAVVGVLSLAVFMSSLDLFIVNLAFPSIAKQYPGTSLSSLSWVLNAYTIVFAAVLVPAGRWADRIGRRRAVPCQINRPGPLPLTCAGLFKWQKCGCCCDR